MIIPIAVGLGATVAFVWTAMGLIVFSLRSPGQSLTDTARLFPDSLCLAVVLYRDRTLPGSVRLRLRIALIYNLQPINLIPDFVPVIGFADNIAVLAWALRGAVRIAARDAITRHWQGTPASLQTLYRTLCLPR